MRLRACVLGEEGVVGINRINKAGTRRWGNQMAGKCLVLVGMCCEVEANQVLLWKGEGMLGCEV